MNERECAKAMAAVLPHGEALLEAHLQKWQLWDEQHPVEPKRLKKNPGYDHQVMLHLFAGDAFTPHLMKCLETGTDAAPCLRLLERMWQEGNSFVRNVLDVTILERLSDDQELWQAVGRQVSPVFRETVNRVIMPGNSVYATVRPM